MRPIFCGNFDTDTRQSDLERLFAKYGRLERVDMKTGSFSEGLKGITEAHSELVNSVIDSSGFAFVYFNDERDAEDAIRALDNIPFGYSRRRLSVEWARGERGSRYRDGSRPSANVRPTKTLFVINFDPIRTRTRDIERHFEPYGKVLHVRIRRNFAFVQFERQEDATKALELTNMSKILDRVVSVEYAIRDDNDRDSPTRGGIGGYGRRGDSPYGRSVSPVHHRGSRPSPDYGRPRSPYYGKPRSPVYGRPRSPVYGKPHSPVYGRPRSPVYGRPHSPVYGRPRSPVYGRPQSPGYDRYNALGYRNHSRSPIRR